MCGSPHRGWGDQLLQTPVRHISSPRSPFSLRERPYPRCGGIGYGRSYRQLVGNLGELAVHCSAFSLRVFRFREGNQYR